MSALSWPARITLILMLVAIFLIGIAALFCPRRIQQRYSWFLRSTFPEPLVLIGLRIVGAIYVVVVLVIAVILLFFTNP
jgi:hypothetical protein